MSVSTDDESWDDRLHMARPTRSSPTRASEHVSALKSPTLVRKALRRRDALLMRGRRARKHAPPLAADDDEAPLLRHDPPAPTTGHHDWEAVAPPPRGASLLRYYYERARTWVAQALSFRPPPLDVSR
jgi:hypothetical protein